MAASEGSKKRKEGKKEAKRALSLFASPLDFHSSFHRNAMREAVKIPPYKNFS
jgi:hypothetical protein